MTKAEELIARLEGHEKECLVRYDMIQRQLDSAGKDIAVNRQAVFALYPFILGAIVLGFSSMITGRLRRLPSFLVEWVYYPLEYMKINHSLYVIFPCRTNLFLELMCWIGKWFEDDLRELADFWGNCRSDNFENK